MMPSDERNYYQGHAAADVAATYGTNLATTLAVYIERIPAPLSALRADRAGALQTDRSIAELAPTVAG